MLILRTLLFDPSHGHQIARHIQRTTEDVLQVEHGSIYPGLHGLERRTKWEMAKDRNREFKYPADLGSPDGSNWLAQSRR